MSGFLDNSGDIILDAVLTDVGRQRMARADGSFNVTAFAFADDEINYKLYDASAAGANKDLNIMKTPVFEAFTDSRAGVNHRLLTLTISPSTLYLPVARLNTKSTTNQPFPGFPFAASDDNGGTENQFVVLSDQRAYDKYVGPQNNSSGQMPNGFINGTSPQTASPSLLVVDQGLDTPELGPQILLQEELNEDSYIIQMDNRLLKLTAPDGNQFAESFVDTDNIATYVVNEPQFYSPGSTGPNATKNTSPIQGPRGETFKFSLSAAIDAQSSDFLYDQKGATLTNYFPEQKASGNRNAKAIDTIVRLTGNKTGVTLDVPVRVVRAIS